MKRTVYRVYKRAGAWRVSGNGKEVYGGFRLRRTALAWRDVLMQSEQRYRARERCRKLGLL